MNDTAQETARLWLYAYNDGKTELLSNAEFRTLADPQEGYVWLHLRYDLEDAGSILEAVGLDEAVIQALTTDETRPRMMRINGGLLLVLRAINNNPNADPEDMISLRIWLCENYVITARRSDRKLLSIEDVKQQFENNQPPISSGEFLAVLVDCMADRIREMVDAINENLISFESDIEYVDRPDTRTRVTTLRKQVATILRYLQPQRDALEALCQVRAPFSESDLAHLRAQTDRTQRYVEDLNLARERAAVLLDEARILTAEKQSNTLYILSLITTIFLPLSFLTGVFGMNVAGLPGTENPSAFAVLMFSMVVLAVGVGIAIWRRP